QTGEREEGTSWPRQGQRKPGRTARNRCRRNGQPDQLVVRFIGGSTTPQKLHRDLLQCRENMLSALPPTITPNSTIAPQQTIRGRRTARTALPVSISCARERPMQSSTRL